MRPGQEFVVIFNLSLGEWECEHGHQGLTMSWMATSGNMYYSRVLVPWTGLTTRLPFT